MDSKLNLHTLLLVLFFCAISIFFTSCVKEQVPKTATVELNFIDSFPKEVILYQLDENYITKIDTFTVDNSEDLKIEIDLNRSKFLNFYIPDEVQYEFYVEPNSHLIVEKQDSLLQFTGDLKEENEFLQASIHDKELKKLNWNYDAPFEEFKEQVAAYYAYEDSLAKSFVIDNEHFNKTIEIDARAKKNMAHLDYINRNIPKEQQDSLHDIYFDQNLLDFDKYIQYLDADYLRHWYDRYATSHFMKKKYGNNLDSLYKKRGSYDITAEIISENYPSPLKESLLHSALNVYPILYNRSSDEVAITPRKLLERHKADLPEKVYAKIEKIIVEREEMENRTAKGKPMPAFSFLDKDENKIELTPVNNTKPLLIDVWASWCGPCISSFPKVKKLQEEYGEQLNIVSVSLDNDFTSFQEGLKKNEVPGRVKYYAEGAFESEFANYFMLQAIPRYIFVDENGHFIDSNTSPDFVKKYLSGSES